MPFRLQPPLRRWPLPWARWLGVSRRLMLLWPSLWLMRRAHPRRLQRCPIRQLPGGRDGLPLAAAMVPPPAAVGLLPSSTSAPDAQTAFLDKITRRTSSLLPGPSVSRHRGMSVPPRVCPRRSRRLAGVEAEVIPADLEGRPRKKAMRSLNIIDEHEGLTQQT